jgi:hypothetical protein
VVFESDISGVEHDVSSPLHLLPRVAKKSAITNAANSGAS